MADDTTKHIPGSVEHYDDQLREANEKLYAHSLELATRNKTLSLLSQLDEISIQTLDPETLAEKIARIVREALEFELVSILSFDASADTLIRVASNRSERLEKVIRVERDAHAGALITNVSAHPFFAPILSGEPNYASSIEPVWGGIIPPAGLKRIEEEAHIRTVLAYPLRIDGKLTDVLILGFNREYADLSQFERDSLESIVDVTAVALDRARIYMEMQRLNVELTDANKQQVTLIHFITHQLKGFVAKSRNIFSLIQEGDFGPVPEAMKPMIDEGFNSSTKGAQTIQEILNAANIKSGKLAMTMLPFDFKELVQSLVKELKPNADAKHISLTLDAPDEPIQFTGDRAQLENAIKNLIDNTIKYTQKGSIKVSLAVSEGHIRFMTEDTGVGITPEDMKYLFTEGGHGAESLKVNVDSTGFGLYIVKNIIEAHNGKVWAESEGAGKGSKFIVELPVSG